ncbi:hypothetical protein [Streptomyces californicus]|uniref:hypothetical protein n=1 Tax=Streptomyces californicus TaxID=67351 RepID=UPI00296FA541|nr:hypothetical protein [Streptomyces californicus]MDW4912608.1 hypothetical protein [Streptomyces californicus]
MPRNGTTRLDPTTLIERLEAACDAVEDGGDLYETFNGLVDYVRSHQSEEELARLAKAPTHPDLKAGDVILIDGLPFTVRGIKFHAPHKHAGSGLPQNRPATEIITSQGSQYLALVPEA